MGKSYKERRSRNEGNWRKKLNKNFNKKWQTPDVKVKPSQYNSNNEYENNENNENNTQGY